MNRAFDFDMSTPIGPGTLSLTGRVSLNVVSVQGAADVTPTKLSFDADASVELVVNTAPVKAKSDVERVQHGDRLLGYSCLGLLNLKLDAAHHRLLRRVGLTRI